MLLIEIDLQKDMIISFYNYLKFKGYINKNSLNKLLSNKWVIQSMTKITNEEVKKVAHLARLELNEDEINNHA